MTPDLVTRRIGSRMAEREKTREGRSGADAPGLRDRRGARLARALRDNLRKRKAQSRGREATDEPRGDNETT